MHSVTFRSRVIRRSPAAHLLPPFTALLGLLLAALVLLQPAPASGGAPEYMKLEARIGLGIEVKGAREDNGFFVATDIQVLEEPRRPKLRGPISALDREAGILEIFGVPIEITDKTEIDTRSIEDLRVKDQIEVKCTVDEETGVWRANSIATRGIKSSNKIKGTITEMNLDGVPPDTLGISGLKILLVRQTDLDLTELSRDPLEAYLFGDIGLQDATLVDNGLVMGDGRFLLSGEYRHNLRTANEFDLTGRFDSDQDDTQPEVRAQLAGYWSEHVRTFVEARARKKYVLTSDLDADSGDLDLHLTEAFVLVRDIASRGLALKVGRQDFDEPREWLYDEYLDAVRLYLYGSGLLTLEFALIDPVSPIKEKLDSWTDYLGKVDWHLHEDGVVSAYVLARRDSDKSRNREPVWWGLRYFGEIGRSWKPWLDLAIMRGEDKQESARGWAIDVGGTFQARKLPLRPSLTAGYAFGSGDETGDDAHDNTFRQTGYQDNSARMGGVTSVRYYGVVIDPELSNLEILTLGAGVRPVPGASVELFYHKYRQQWPDDRLRGDLIDPPARPNGFSDDIGWGLDLVVGIPRFLPFLKASMTLGMFEPGGAYNPRQDRAYLTKVNMTIGL